MSPSSRRPRSRPPSAFEADPLWYKDAVIYELHVRAFSDSAGDGVGDFRGLAGKLDYLRDLGVTAVWLLPFYPSPLRDDGYDIAHYTEVHPSYGTLADFRLFLREAHRRGLRVITELVVNHTSDQHPWFQRARRSAPGSAARDFYVWSTTKQRYQDARIIFKDFETSNWTWDPLANAYYWHRFYSHQPDLNYENPQVRAAIKRVLDFWMALGVDGMRLDAVPYLHEREGTGCENLPETHGALKELRAHVDAGFKGRMLLGEANQWPEDAVAYFGSGDECHMAFHFPLMPRMFMAVRMEDRYPIIDILDQTPAIPESCQWALFLRNHDELTLEMVTDEERDYMYRVYAHDPQARINLGIRRRLAPLLGNDRRRIELMTGLLLSLPGTPVLYYGDEIGMGDNIFLGDRNGVRTPMQWSDERNAGFSTANPQRLYLPLVVEPGYSHHTANVQAQQDNPHSLLWFHRRLIALRQRFRAFGRGSLEFLYPANRKVLAFVRRHEQEQVLVVANLSRYSQCVELDLSAFRGQVLVELFGQNEFPAVGDRPYVLTLGPHSFYWFTLEAPRRAVQIRTEDEVPALALAGGPDSLLRGRARESLDRLLPELLVRGRWFRRSERRLKSAAVADAIPVNEAGHLALVHVEYHDGDPETYLVPLAIATGERAQEVRQRWAPAVLARVSARGAEGVLYDALEEPQLTKALLEAIGRRRRLKGAAGDLVGIPAPSFRRLRGPEQEALEPQLLHLDQRNTCVRFGTRLILKLFRRLDPGINPELEIGRFLTETAGFTNAPSLAGWLEYESNGAEPLTVGVLQGYVANEGDAWQVALDGVARYYERVRARSAELAPPARPLPLVQLIEGDIPRIAHELIGTFLEQARLLGQRTAELHITLTGHLEDPAFAPEPFTPFYQRSLYQSMRNATEQAFQLLRRRLPELTGETRSAAERVAGLQAEVLRRFRAVTDRRYTALRARLHGDLHLPQLLWTGRDFVFIDFEGDALDPISARRIKRSPLRDVAGLIRSFHHAAATGLVKLIGKGEARAAEAVALEPWAEYWFAWVSSAFLRAYLKTAGAAAFLPQGREELAELLQVYVLDKAVHEMANGLAARAEWVGLSLRAVAQFVDGGR
jgi:maltose alpha-D-glucosyltransferase/alpha-amylase